VELAEEKNSWRFRPGEDVIGAKDIEFWIATTKFTAVIAKNHFRKLMVTEHISA